MSVNTLLILINLIATWAMFIIVVATIGSVSAELGLAFIVFSSAKFLIELVYPLQTKQQGEK